MKVWHTWKIVPRPDCAFSHDQGNNDRRTHTAAAVAEAKAALVAANALEEQDAAAAAALKANVQGRVPDQSLYPLVVARR